MNKRIRILIAALAVCCLLTACNFYTNFNDTTGSTQMESLPQVEKMMAALADRDMDAALELVHSDRTEDALAMLLPVANYLNGREVAQLEQTSLSVKNSASAQGSTRQENGALNVVLEDGEAFYLSVCYVTQENAEGFYTFQLVLGLV